MRQIIHASAIALCVLVTVPVSSTANACDILSVTVSGALSLSSRNIYFTEESRLDPSDRPVLDLSLESIGAGDSDVRLRFVRAEDRTWLVQLVSTLKKSEAEDKEFDRSSTVQIEFDEQGIQKMDQWLYLYPMSNNPVAAQSTVALRFSGFQLIDGDPKVLVKDTSKKQGQCIVQGALDVTNEVNAGRPVEVKYYPPELALEAMLNDQPERNDENRN